MTITSTTLRTFEPAWAYRRHHWPIGTGIEWVTGTHGDELRLWLPASFIGIHIEDRAAVEALAWQEQRVGVPLGQAWSSQRERGAHGYRIYRVEPGIRTQPTITTGVTIEVGHIPVWPTPTGDGGRWQWYDHDGIPLLGSPPEREIYTMRGKWREELTLAFDTDAPPATTPEDYLSKFVAETFVPNGPEHRLTTEEIYGLYGEWADLVKLSERHRVPKIMVGRWLSESPVFHRWAGRTKAGYRRGFTGLRLPDGAWLS